MAGHCEVVNKARPVAKGLVAGETGMFWVDILSPGLEALSWGMPRPGHGVALQPLVWVSKPARSSRLQHRRPLGLARGHIPGMPRRLEMVEQVGTAFKILVARQAGETRIDALSRPVARGGNVVHEVKAILERLVAGPAG